MKSQLGVYLVDCMYLSFYTGR